jgi:hypothetical protein
VRVQGSLEQVQRTPLAHLSLEPTHRPGWGQHL